MLRRKFITLSRAETGQPLRIEAIHGGQAFISRITGMGFLPGTSLVVLQNFNFGPIIVHLRDTQVAIGRKEAKKIEVHPTKAEEISHA